MTETDWLVYCPEHKHYLVHVSVGGTTWCDNQADAKRYTKTEAVGEAKLATWLDHNPTPWAVAAA